VTPSSTTGSARPSSDGAGAPFALFRRFAHRHLTARRRRSLLRDQAQDVAAAEDADKPLAVDDRDRADAAVE